MVAIISRTLFLFAAFLMFVMAMVGLGALVMLITYYALISL